LKKAPEVKFSRGGKEAARGQLILRTPAAYLVGRGREPLLSQLCLRSGIGIRGDRGPSELTCGRGSGKKVLENKYLLDPTTTPQSPKERPAIQGAQRKLSIAKVCENYIGEGKKGGNNLSGGSKKGEKKTVRN